MRIVWTRSDMRGLELSWFVPALLFPIVLMMLRGLALSEARPVAPQVLMGRVLVLVKLVLAPAPPV